MEGEERRGEGRREARKERGEGWKSSHFAGGRRVAVVLLISSLHLLLSLLLSSLLTLSALSPRIPR